METKLTMNGSVNKCEYFLRYLHRSEKQKSSFKGFLKCDLYHHQGVATLRSGAMVRLLIFQGNCD